MKCCGVNAMCAVTEKHPVGDTFHRATGGVFFYLLAFTRMMFCNREDAFSMRKTVFVAKYKGVRSADAETCAGVSDDGVDKRQSACRGGEYEHQSRLCGDGDVETGCNATAERADGNDSGQWRR